MTHARVVAELAAIEGGIEPADVRLVWGAVRMEAGVNRLCAPFACSWLLPGP